MTTLLALLIVFYLLVVELFHDKFVIWWGQATGKLRDRYSTIWHALDVTYIGPIVFVLFLMLFHNHYDAIRWTLFFAAMRYGPWSFALNIVRKQDWNHSGKNILDVIGGRFKIPQFLLLIFSIVVLCFGTKTNYMIDNLISWNGAIAGASILLFSFLANKIYNKKWPFRKK